MGSSHSVPEQSSVGHVPTDQLLLCGVNRPSMCSISFSQLMELDAKASEIFAADYPLKTMRDICEKIIKPCCQENGKPYALFLNPNGLKIDAFITHTWDEPFVDFVESIRTAFQCLIHKPNLWICAFALMQDDNRKIKLQVGCQDTSLEDSPFVQALKCASTFVVVRNSHTDLYSRIWCVCELIFAMKLGLVPSKTLVTGPDSFSNSKISCLDAKSFDPYDKARIQTFLLTKHKFHEIDEMIRMFRKQHIPSFPSLENGKKPPRRALKVFQASPLAYVDFTGKETQIEVLDLELEITTLTEALEESGVDVVFVPATADRLGAFLSQGNRFLHFSCHGHPLSLFIENEYGGAQQLLVDENLKSWLQAGGNSLSVVFVSACHSRFAGQMFVDAGVEHVVCCEKNEHVLSNAAAIIFARGFYRSMANGRTIQQAFDLAKHAVIQSPEIRDAGLDPKKEAAKFALLPEGKKHDFHILFDEVQPKQTPLHPGTLSRSSTESSALPFPPQIFIGREIEMYRVLKALFLGKNRLVRIRGPEGMGKSSLAKALADYMDKRNMWGKVLWMPPIQKGKGNDTISLWSDLFKVLESDKSTASFKTCDQYQSLRQKIVEQFREKKAVIFVDCGANESSALVISRFSIFLQELFEQTKHTKVVAIIRKDQEVQSDNPDGFPCLETEIALGPLDFTSTVTLFGRVCPHVFHYNQFCNTMNRKKSDATFNVLGSGIPAMVVRAGKNLSYDKYLDLVEKKESINEDDWRDSLSDLNATFSELQVESPEIYRQLREQSEIPSIRAPQSLISLKASKTNPLRPQAQVSARFAPLLRKEGLVHRKNVTSFIRRASKGEHIKTTIDGVHESEQTVKNDTSWVVCGRAAGEYYILTDKEFNECYDEKSATAIKSHSSALDRRLHRKGFLEYRSKRQVWAHKVDEDDMAFFRYGKKPDMLSSAQEAYFEAPWGESMRVELGDFLVMQYPNGNEEVYRVERTVFEYSYTDATSDSDRKKMSWIATMVAASLLFVASAAAVTARQRRKRN